jgi:hypothetical protein
MGVLSRKSLSFRAMVPVTALGLLRASCASRPPASVGSPQTSPAVSTAVLTGPRVAAGRDIHRQLTVSVEP